MIALTIRLSHADTQNVFHANATDLSIGTNYTPAIPVPTAAPTADVQFVGPYTGGTTFTISGNALSLGTLNDLNATQALVVTNTVAGGSIQLNSVANGTAGAAPGDLLYVAAGGNLTINNGTGLTLLLNHTGDIENAHLLTLAAPITITAGDTIAFTGAGATTVSGAIAATTGALVINDAGGTVTLSGTNLYTGGTTLIAGTLNFNSATAIGGTPGTLVVEGGLLDNTSGGALTNANNNAVTLAANLTFVGTNSLNLGTGLVTLTGDRTVTVDASTLTIGGSIAGTGFSLTKAGAGVLVLNGTDTYSGGTINSAGTLVVGDSHALSGGPVTNDAILETSATTVLGSAPKTINVGGAFTQNGGGSLVLQVVTDQGGGPLSTQAAAGVNYDTLAATGTAALAGTITLHFQAAADPSNGERFQVVSSTAGPVTGSVPVTVTGTVNSAFIPYTTYNDSYNGLYAPNSVVLTLLQPFTTFGGLTPNQFSVASNVDSQITALDHNGIMNTGSGTNVDFWNNVVTGLTVASSSGSLGRSLDELSPQRYEILRNVAFDNYAFDIQSLDDEFARERDGRGGIDTAGFAFNDSALGPQLSQIKGRLLAWTPAPDAHGLLSDSAQSVLGGVQMSDAKDMKEITPEAILNKWNGFIDGGVDLGDVEHNADVSHSNYTTGRVRGGFDYLVAQNFRLGAFFGYGHTDVDLDEEGSKATINSYTPGVFATYADKKGFYANGVFTYTRNDYNTDRNIIIPGVNRTATGSPSGDQFGGDLDGGYEFHHGAWTFGPSAGMTYVNLGIDSFSESGAGAASLNVNNQSAESLRSRLGGTVRYDARIGSVLVTPHLSAFWQHEFLDGGNFITSQFEGLPAGSFAVQTTSGDSDNALLGFGIDANVTNSLTLFIDYDTEAGGSTFFGQSASGGVRVSF